MRVFYPRNCVSGFSDIDTTLLAGWNNPGGDIVVVTALPSLDVELVTRILKNDAVFDKQPAAERTAADLYEQFYNRRLSVVGIHFSKHSACLSSPPKDGIAMQNGMLHEKTYSSENYTMIYYDPPRPTRMEFFTLRPSTLYVPINSDKRLKLSQALEFHLSDTQPSHDNLNTCIAQINCVSELQPVIRRNAIALLAELAKDPQLIKKQRAHRTQSQTKPKRSRRGSLSLDVVAKFVAHKPVLYVFVKYRQFIERLLVLLENTKFRSFNLLSLFCTAQQLHLRLNQFCYLPMEYIVIQKRSKNGWHWLNPTRNNAYNRFYNHIWLCINDLLFGFYISYRLYTNAAQVGALLEYTFQNLMINQVVRATNWLTSWPAGFKLNPQLAHFIGEVTIWTIYTWSLCGSLIFNRHVSAFLIRMIALSGILGGATLQISLVVDIISFAGFHVYILSQSLSRVYSQQLNVLISLFRLFRGLKYNKLRNRVDHGNYDLNQLFLGTIMFTASVFLLPTVFAFYVVFKVASLALIAIVAVLCVLLACLNHFPLFPLLLRIKTPCRVPSGIYFVNERKFGCLQLKSKPMMLSEIFRQYTDTMNRFSKDILNMKSILGVLTGKSFKFQQAELYASLYSVLPQKRDTVEEMYLAMSEYLNVN